MNNKVIVIISTAEREKVLTGLMYTINALKNLWLDDIKFFFFGPSQKLILEDSEIRKYLKGTRGILHSALF